MAQTVQSRVSDIGHSVSQMQTMRFVSCDENCFSNSNNFSMHPDFCFLCERINCMGGEKLQQIKVSTYVLKVCLISLDKLQFFGCWFRVLIFFVVVLLFLCIWTFFTVLISCQRLLLLTCSIVKGACKCTLCKCLCSESLAGFQFVFLEGSCFLSFRFFGIRRSKLWVLRF